MREEIRKLFPLEFYINDKEEMVAEISINTLNKLSDEIIKLEDESNFYHCMNELNEIQARKYSRILEKANNKLQTMFDNGDENSVLDDLLELKDILEELG